MRFLAALTVLSTFALFVTGSSSAGQTIGEDRTQARAKSSKTLIREFFALQARNDLLLAKVRGTPVTCKGAEKAIVYYRNQVWARQDLLSEPRIKTAHPERKKGACAYKRWLAFEWQAKAKKYTKLVAKIESNRPTAICYVFGKYCSQALAVARCESGHSYSIHAQNGQYRGMFQMGSSERRIYGHGNTALAQAKAAHRYFVASGRDWSPWSCKPW